MDFVRSHSPPELWVLIMKTHYSVFNAFLFSFGGGEPLCGVLILLRPDRVFEILHTQLRLWNWNLTIRLCVNGILQTQPLNSTSRTPLIFIALWKVNQVKSKICVIITSIFISANKFDTQGSVEEVFHTILRRCQSEFHIFNLRGRFVNS